jgi:GGDEF domain-containing protein
MTTNRIYKGRKTIAQAIEELKYLSTKQFDPKVVSSAVVVLKNVIIDKNINQLPTTKLEEERFAYFYKDRLSQAYNQDYLEVVLLEKNSTLNLNYLILFSIHDFSLYNKENGWEQGDKLLGKIGNTLVMHFDNALVFRVFGDDFAVMHSTKLDTKKVQKELDILIQNSTLNYDCTLIDLTTQDIKCLTDIEMIQIREQ